MRLLSENTILKVTADNQVSDSFQAENVLDVHPSVQWRGSGALSHLTMISSQGPTGLLLANVTGTVDHISCSSVGAVVWDDVDWQAVGWGEEVATNSFNDDINTGNIFYCFPAINSTAQIDLFLAAPGQGVGVALISPTINIEALFPIVSSFSDTSPQKRLLNGNMYYEKRNILRTFDITLRAQDHQLMADYFHYGNVPRGFFVDDYEDPMVIFGAYKAPPRETTVSAEDVEISINIEELL